MSDLINNKDNMDLDNEITPTQNDTDNDYMIALLAQKEELELSGFNMRPQYIDAFERQYREYQENNSNFENNNSSSDVNKETENDEAIARQLQENFIREQKYYNFLQGNRNVSYPGNFEANIPKTNITEYHNAELQRQFNEKYVKEKLSYEYFKNKLYSKDALPLRKLISAFYKDFEQKSKHFSPQEQSQYLRDNLTKICNKLIEHPLWVDNEKEEKENAIIHMEKIVTKKLYNITFAPSEDLAKDALLSNKIFKHSWVEPKHFDFSDFDFKILDKAGNELEKMNLYKCYFDKINCIVNCINYIKDAYIQNISNEKDFTNDTLLTLLILIILKTNPKKLISNVNYIDRYINRNFLNIGIYSFSLQTIEGAITFIEKNLSQESLNISPEDYDAKIIEMTKKANEKLEESSNNARIYDKINRDNNTGGIIQSIQTLGSSIGSTLESTIENTIGIGSTIGSTIGNTIGSIFSNDSSKSKMSVSDTPLQGYFENIEKDRSINRNESSFSKNIAIHQKESIQRRQNNSNEHMTGPIMGEQLSEEDKKNLDEADEKLNASLGLS